jgi:hypothetical protein
MRPWQYWLGWCLGLLAARIVLVNPILKRLDDIRSAWP